MPVLLALAFFALLLATPRAGADYDRYLDWARVFASGDLFALRGDGVSPMGVPFNQWSPATGALYAIPSFLTGETIEVARSARIASAAAAIVFWLAMSALLLRAARGDREAWLTGLAALFLGTHAGYES